MKKETLKLNESVLQMKLNADNRAAFINAILKDAFLARSDAIRDQMEVLIKTMQDLTFGLTPQARSANKGLIEKTKTCVAALSAKGFDADIRIGTKRSCIICNLGGSKVWIYFKSNKSTKPCINFHDEYFTSDNSKAVYLGTDEITLASDHKLVKDFWALKGEADDLMEAKEELQSMLNTILGKAQNLAAAVKKWPDLANYAPSILSACRELVVRPEDLSLKIEALRSGVGSVKQAMAKKQ